MKKLMIVILVLFYTTPVWAMPHMLWYQNTFLFNTVQVVKPWRKYVDIFDTAQDCDKKVQEHAKGTGRDAKGTGRGRIIKSSKGYAIVEIIMDGSITTIKYYCFPVGQGPQ